MTKSKKKTKRLKTKEVSELNEFVENDNLVIEKDKMNVQNNSNLDNNINNPVIDIDEFQTVNIEIEKSNKNDNLKEVNEVNDIINENNTLPDYSNSNIIVENKQFINNPNSTSLELIYESTHDNSHQQLENDYSEISINLPDDSKDKINSSKRANRKNKKDDDERASSRESSMENAGKRKGNEEGVNPLIIKGMQDRMESINKSIDEIQTRSMDGYNTVMQFSDSFFALKKKYEDESEARATLEERINFVNKIFNNMELQ